MRLLTPPTAEPVSVDAVRSALRIDDDRYDAVLPGLISAARMVAEQELGRQLLQQVWRVELVEWPSTTDAIPVCQATACSITYWNGSTWVALAGNAYAFAPDAVTGNGTVLAPALNTAWPTLGAIAIGPRVRIDLTAGIAPELADTVPDCVKTFITALVGQVIQSPELSATAAMTQHPLLARLLDSQRVY